MTRATKDLGVVQGIPAVPANVMNFQIAGMRAP
jgi:hypothetical protein